MNNQPEILIEQGTEYFHIVFRDPSHLVELLLILGKTNFLNKIYLKHNQNASDALKHNSEVIEFLFNLLKTELAQAWMAIEYPYGVNKAQ